MMVRLPSLARGSAELDALGGALLRADIQLATLTGPPGVGTSRLALAYALTDRAIEASVLNNLGEGARCRGAWEQAERY